MTSKFKLICWNGIALPAPLSVKWIAWDRDGSIWGYTGVRRPVPEDNQCWYSPGDYCFNTTLNTQARQLSPSTKDRGFRLLPPETGKWHEQLYWVGD